MKKTLRVAAIGIGFLVLIGLALVRRGLAVGSEVPPRTAPSFTRVNRDADAPEGSVVPVRQAAEISVGAFPAPPMPFPESKRALRHAEEDFWEDLGALLEARSKMEPAKYREKVSALTADYLGLDTARAAVFDRTAAGATEEIGRAWKLRNESVEALSDTLSRDLRERRELEIQEAYEAAKVRAIVPLESLLESSPRHERFRTRLGEWLDAVR
jgi:hypothetical protein